jgi:glyoxylase-like metal-dependent hydrolase (beta-lactamase superfamily II)
MNAKPLWGPIETPDGVWIPGPHGVSGASEIYGGISGGIGIIESGGEAILTDVGYRTTPEYPPGVLDTVTEIVDERGLDVKYLVQTHFHFDHVGNTEHVADRYDATVVCHPREKEILEDPMMATTTEYFESMGADPAQVAAELTLDGPEDVTFPEDTFAEHFSFPIEVDGTVEDGDILEIGELEIEVLHTPGHTPGHLSLWNPMSGSLYLMDVMYWPTPIHPHPIGRADEQIASVEKCLDLDADYLFAGHELPRCGKPDVADYLKDMLIKQKSLATRIKVLLSRHGALTVPDIHRESYVIKERYDYAHDGWFSYSLACIQSHLRRLLDRGEVERVDLDGEVGWAVTAEGRLPEDEIAVRGGYEARTLTVEDV